LLGEFSVIIRFFTYCRMLLKKRFALLGASLLGALFGASTVQGPKASQVEDVAATVTGPTYVPRTFAARTPAPAKPATEPVAPRQVAMKAPIMADRDFVRFIERPMRRKVKYGKNRWVILG
jgi:hypothetical protein